MKLALVSISVAVVLPVTARPADASVSSDFDVSKHVQLNSGGIVVTWVSTSDEDGVVEWALSADDLADRSGTFATATDSRGALAGRLNKRTHRVPVSNIRGGSTIHYDIVSGGERHPSGPYRVTIPSAVLLNPPVGLTGRVRYADGASGRECLVYIRVTQTVSGTRQSSLWHNTITDGGGFTAEIRNVRARQNFDTALAFEPDTDDATIEASALCGPGLQGSVAKTTADATKLTVLGRVAEYQEFDIVVSSAPVSSGGAQGAAGQPMPEPSGGGCLPSASLHPAAGVLGLLALALPAAVTGRRRTSGTDRRGAVAAARTGRHSG